MRYKWIICVYWLIPYTFEAILDLDQTYAIVRVQVRYSDSRDDFPIFYCFLVPYSYVSDFPNVNKKYDQVRRGTRTTAFCATVLKYAHNNRSIRVLVPVPVRGNRTMSAPDSVRTVLVR